MGKGSGELGKNLGREDVEFMSEKAPVEKGPSSRFKVIQRESITGLRNLRSRARLAFSKCCGSHLLHEEDDEALERLVNDEHIWNPNKEQALPVSMSWFGTPVVPLASDFDPNDFEAVSRMTPSSRRVLEQCLEDQRQHIFEASMHEMEDKKLKDDDELCRFGGEVDVAMEDAGLHAPNVANTGHELRQRNQSNIPQPREIGAF